MSTDQQSTCFRCAALVHPAVYRDTGGLCRKCQKTVPKRVELPDLVACLRAQDKRYRGVYFESYCKRKPTLEALPVLRKAILLDDHPLVKYAAAAIGKLGSKAGAAVPDLLTAAAHVDSEGMPQSYGECLAALVSIDKNHPEIIPLIRRFTHLDNWVPISASLEALAAIGSVEAVELLQELRDKWYPEFNKTQKQVADRLLAESKAQMK